MIELIELALTVFGLIMISAGLFQLFNHRLDRPRKPADDRLYRHGLAIGRSIKNR